MPTHQHQKPLSWLLWLRRTILASGVIWIIGVFILLLVIHRTGQIDEAQPADVIVILGSGVTPDGRPGWALTRRASHAAELWLQGYAPALICTGGQAPRTPRSEAEACRDVLRRYSIPDSAIWLEDESRSTEENALYSQPIIDANGWQAVLLVSDSYHVFRARYLYEAVGIDVALSPVPAHRIRGGLSAYSNSMLREVVALHWQVFKDTLNLPYTHVP